MFGLRRKRGRKGRRVCLRGLGSESPHLPVPAVPARSQGESLGSLVDPILLAVHPNFSACKVRGTGLNPPVSALMQLRPQSPLCCRFKQCLSFYQVATRIPDVFQVPFPKAARGVLAIFEVFNFNIGGLSLPLNCIGLGSYVQQVAFTMVFPLCIAACITLLYVGNAARTKQTLRNGWLKALPSLLALSFFVFPMVSSISFQAFSCEEFDNGKAFLVADFSVECDTSEHSKAKALAALGIMLYPVGISLLYCVLFRKARPAILNDKPTALSGALGFLHLDFEKSWFAWERQRQSNLALDQPKGVP